MIRRCGASLRVPLADIMEFVTRKKDEDNHTSNDCALERSN